MYTGDCLTLGVFKITASTRLFQYPAQARLYGLDARKPLLTTNEFTSALSCHSDLLGLLLLGLLLLVVVRVPLGLPLQPKQ